MQSERDQTKIVKIHVYVAIKYGWKEYVMRQSGGGWRVEGGGHETGQAHYHLLLKGVTQTDHITGTARAVL